MTERKKSKDDFFPGFIYAVQSISAFRLYLGVFIISLKDGHTVRYDAGKYQQEFKTWLLQHGVREA